MCAEKRVNQRKKDRGSLGHLRRIRMGARVRGGVKDDDEEWPDFAGCCRPHKRFWILA